MLVSAMATPFTFIGVPVDSVGRSGGTELGPRALRDLSMPPELGAVDAGDLEVRIRGDRRDPRTGIVGSDDVLTTTATVREAVASAMRRGERPLLAGGCCAELPGALAGARDALERVGLAYLDGHLDLYDGETSPTGEAADMPVSVALGLGPPAWVDVCGGASLMPTDAAIIGYRDLEQSLADGMVDPASIEGLTHMDVGTIKRDGRAVGSTVERSLSSGAGGFWLHLDVDVLDEHVFPATDYLMAGGLSWDELVEVMRPLASSSALVGASIGCYNPEKDPNDSCGRDLVAMWREVLPA
jgi:arginase